MASIVVDIAPSFRHAMVRSGRAYQQVAVLAASDWRFRSTQHIHSRGLHGMDIGVSVGALLRGRSSSHDLAPLVMQMCLNQLCCPTQLSLTNCPSSFPSCNGENCHTRVEDTWCVASSCRHCRLNGDLTHFEEAELQLTSCKSFPLTEQPSEVRWGCIRLYRRSCCRVGTHPRYKRPVHEHYIFFLKYQQSHATIQNH